LQLGDGKAVDQHLREAIEDAGVGHFVDAEVRGRVGGDATGGAHHQRGMTLELPAPGAQVRRRPRAPHRDRTLRRVAVELLDGIEPGVVAGKERLQQHGGVEERAPRARVGHRHVRVTTDPAAHGRHDVLVHRREVEQ
jgi:hypothetical protein